MRGDGRQRLDYRNLQLQVGLLAQANGSSRLKLADTDILVGIKAEVGQIVPEDLEEDENVETSELNLMGTEDRGKIVCTIDCSPGAARELEVHGMAGIQLEFAQLMNRVLNGPHGGLDLKSLCIIPRQSSWILSVSVLILDMGGNALDCLFLATRAALQNTRIPKTEVQEVAEGQYDFELLDTMEPVKGWQDVPVTVTLHRIGNRHVVDPTPIEELTTMARLTVAVNQRGNVCAIQKSGERGIDPSSLSEMIAVAKSTAKDLLTGLDDALVREDERRSKGIEAQGFVAR